MGDKVNEVADEDGDDKGGREDEVDGDEDDVDLGADDSAGDDEGNATKRSVIPGPRLTLPPSSSNGKYF